MSFKSGIEPILLVNVCWPSIREVMTGLRRQRVNTHNEELLDEIETLDELLCDDEDSGPS